MSTFVSFPFVGFDARRPLVRDAPCSGGPFAFASENKATKRNVILAAFLFLSSILTKDPTLRHEISQKSQKAAHKQEAKIKIKSNQIEEK